MKVEDAVPARAATAAPHPADATAALSVRDLKVHFRTRRGIVHAVDGVSFDLMPGETLGLVGESGCGKSTLAKAIVGLVPLNEGSVRVHGQEFGGLSRRARLPFSRRLQMIFQDPFSSLNPRITVGRIVEEPLLVHGIGTRLERGRRVDELLSKVGLRPEMRDRFPHEFSGGQRQRIGIARALALSPQLIICDEPVSALDVSVQAQVINLLMDLQGELGLTYLFISHDLSVVEHIAERIAVMYLGRIVEIAPSAILWRKPLHPYTEALISAVPLPDPQLAQRERNVIEGDIPSQVNPPSGCHFHTRCPYAIERCRIDSPELKPMGDGRYAACLLLRDANDGPTLRGRPERND